MVTVVSGEFRERDDDTHHAFMHETGSCEIVCVRLDGSNDQLIVAPVMTDVSTSGGIGSDGVYARQPKGNLDITGTYFIWTTNLCGNRMDAFLVKVPAQLLVGDTPHQAYLSR